MPHFIVPSSSLIWYQLKRSDFVTLADIRNVVAKFSGNKANDASATDFIMRSLQRDDESPILMYKRRCICILVRVTFDF